MNVKSIPLYYCSIGSWVSEADLALGYHGSVTDKTIESIDTLTEEQQTI